MYSESFDAREFHAIHMDLNTLEESNSLFILILGEGTFKFSARCVVDFDSVIKIAYFV